MMNQILCIDELKTNLQKKNSHSIGRVNNILPFNTNKPITKEVGNTFNTLMGDFVRSICGISLIHKTKTNDDLFEHDPLIVEIMQQIEYKPQHENDLERLLKQYIYSEKIKFNVFHPFMYNFLPSENTAYKNYAWFMADILVDDSSVLKPLFANKEPDNLLSEIVLNNLKLQENQLNDRKSYQPLLKVLTKHYQDDLVFISHYRDFFLKNFGLLTHFYAFIYVCQLYIKFEKFTEADYSQLTPLYFALEWEPLNKRREAADHIESFKSIRSNPDRLFVHVNTMAQLSTNTISNQSNDKNQSLCFFNYREILDDFSSQPEEISQQFIKDINSWIDVYSDIFKRVTLKDKANDLKSAFRILFECIKEGVHIDAAKRYGNHIDHLGGNIFLKRRGSLGTVLNLNHDMLMLLTAVCVKNQRIPLKTLFERFEERGVTLDRISKKAIIQLLDSHNLIDKKSDSGDAQYVKPIL